MIEDLDPSGRVNQWSLVDGVPRCVVDPLDSTDQACVAVIAKNSLIRSLVADTDAFDSDPTINASAEAIALSHWRTPIETDYVDGDGNIVQKTPDQIAELQLVQDMAAQQIQNYLATQQELAPIVDPRPVPQEISDRQFFQIMAMMNVITQDEALQAVGDGTMPAAFEAIISQLPQEQQFPARMMMRGATRFDRSYPLVDIFARYSKPPYTDAQIDDIFRQASRL